MVIEKDITDIVASSQGSGKTFAEFIAEIFKGKFVEIYVGDSYEDISTEQVSMSYPATFCGKVVSAYKECLVISCAFAGAGRPTQMGKLLFISERAIRAMTEVDEKGVLEDTMLRSRDSISIKKTFGE